MKSMIEELREQLATEKAKAEQFKKLWEDAEGRVKDLKNKPTG